ncbi:MAG: metallophosphoesterase [Pirellulales bacterium]|nr:metallophosphoesterase [Pirellulales bacterium]
MSRCYCQLAAVLWAVGWTLAAHPAGAWAVEPFSVVLLPDTQEYTLMAPINNPYSAQTSWIVNNMEAENIKFTIHLGDIVENNNLYPSQWDIADAAHAILEQAPTPMPYSVMPGNHDMTGSGSPDYTRDSTLYNQYFGRNRFVDKPWYGGSFGLTNNSNYSFFQAGGMDFLVLSLELMPRDQTLDWANDVIDAHPDHRVIVATHKYLTENGLRDTQTVYGNFTGNNANQIFDKLIRDHENVFMVVCGHVGPEALNVATNAAGKPVYEILSDYQNLPGGGDGWLRTLKFLPDVNQIVVGSYSPTLDRHNYGSELTLPYDMGGTTPTIPTTPVRLAAHWRLDDGQVNPLVRTAADASPHGNDGELVNFGTPPTWSGGRLGGALRFDGTNDRVDVGVTESLDLTADLSMTFWLKPTGAGSANYGALVGKNQSGGAGNDGYFTDIVYAKSVTGATVAAGTVEFAVTSEGVNTVVRSAAALSLGDDTWHHVAVTYQAGARMAVYIDGVLSGELAAGVPEACAATSFPFSLGNLGQGSSTDAYCFNGLLDDVRVFEGALTPGQIGRLAAGVEPFLPGDANGDDAVDGADAAVLASHWLGAVVGGAFDGDFNVDGWVDDLDLAILAANWQTGGSAGSVPEPAVLASLGAAVAFLALWRSRRVLGR